MAHPSFDHRTQLQIEKIKAQMVFRKKTAEELSEELNLPKAQVLYYAGLAHLELSETPSRTYQPQKKPTSRTRNETPREKLEALTRGVNAGFSRNDLGYFLDLSLHTIERDLTELELQTKTKILGHVSYLLRNRWRSIRVTYRLASQIYELADKGLDQDEIVERFRTNELMISAIVSKRRAFEPTLIEKLQLLYADRKKNNCYKQKT